MIQGILGQSIFNTIQSIWWHMIQGIVGQSISNTIQSIWWHMSQGIVGQYILPPYKAYGGT